MFTTGLGYLLVAFLCPPSLALAQSETAKPSNVQTEDEADSKLLLEGVIITLEPDSSVALVRRPHARRARPVRVGESVYGMTLVAVSEESAVFERDGRQFLIYLDGEKTGMDDSAASAWLSRELERSATEERLAKEMPVILTETGISPRLEGGESPGLRITHLPDGTLLSEIGLLPGDVLLSVNDVPLTSMSALAGLFPQLRSESEIRLIVERQGRTLGLEYRIR
jgi:type II secretion system protein C